MKIANVLIATGLVLAIAGQAMAFSLENPMFQGQMKLKLSNWDAARSYVPVYDDERFWEQGDTIILSDTDVDADVSLSDVIARTDTSVATWFDTPSTDSLMDGESAWGIVHLDEITDPLTGNELWRDDAPYDDVWGIFYGIEDLHVTIRIQDDGGTPGDPTDDVIEETIWGGGDVMLELYELPDPVVGGGNRFEPETGPGSRGPDANDYAGITDIGTLILKAEAVNPPESGEPSAIAGLSKFLSVALINNAGEVVPQQQGEGSARVNFDLLGGSATTIDGFGPFTTHPDLPDIDFNADTFADLTGNGWTANSDDPAWTFAAPIPEPVTMFTGAMAIGALGGYIRRRRR